MKFISQESVFFWAATKRRATQIVLIGRYFRITKFQIETAEGRSDERIRRAFITMASSLLSRGVSLVVMIATVSLTLPYLGAERFGAWMALASMAGMLSFLDLGVSNALTNEVTSSAAVGVRSNLIITISGGLGFVAVLAVCLIISMSVASCLVPWRSLVRVNSPDVSSEIESAVRVFIILFCLGIVASGAQRIFFGLQRGFDVHLTSAVGSMFSLGALAYAAKHNQGIPVLVACAMGGNILAAFFLIFLLVKEKLLDFGCMRRGTAFQAKRLFRVSGLFLVLQIGGMIGWGADSIIISSVLGAAQVGAFNLTQRVFQAVSQPVSMLNAPLWPAFSDAHSRGEKLFIRRTLVRSIAASLLVSLSIGLAVVLSSKWIVRAWTKGSIEVSPDVIWAYFAWVVIDAAASAFAMFMNGCGIVKPQVLAVLTLIVVAVPVKYLLVSNFGLSAMLVGFIIVFLINIIIWFAVIFRKEILNQLY